MFTDLVGFSTMSQSDEAGALSLLRIHNRELRSIFPKHFGREIKTVGDGFLVEFPSALDATRCALEIQRTVQRYNSTHPENGAIRLRIGIHVGDVVEENGDVLGDSVNLASRIQQLAGPGGIIISRQVFDLVEHKVDAAIVQLPAVALRNIRGPTVIYRVGPSGEPPVLTTAPPTPDERHNLAVLPLANVSPDPADAYFAEGLTDEIISVLSQVRGLSVIARSSVAQYKLAPKSIAAVGAELGVDSILEGSVRKAGNRLRISLQLVDVPTQRDIWARSYDRQVDDVFAVQTDVADRTAEALQLELTKSKTAEEKRPPTSNLQAYDLYLRGLVASGRPNQDGRQEAMGFFDRATRLDPTFAEAYAAWANLYVALSGDYFSVKEAMPEARRLAARALELNPNSSEARATMANIAMQFDQDWKRAEEEFERAIALNPNNVPAYSFYGLLLIALGRIDEAKEIFRQAIRRDPATSHARHLAWAEVESGNFETAIEYGLEEIRRDPGNVHAHVFLGLTYLYAGRSADARREAKTPLRGAGTIVQFDHALLNALVGRPAEARQLLREAAAGTLTLYVSSTDLAMLRAALGESRTALDLLEKDVADGDAALWLYYRGIYFDSVRKDPRFVALLKRFRLPTGGILRAPSPGAPARAKGDAKPSGRLKEHGTHRRR